MAAGPTRIPSDVHESSTIHVLRNLVICCTTTCHVTSLRAKMWFGPRRTIGIEPPKTEEIEARLGVDVDTLSPVGKLWLQSWDLSDSFARFQMGSSLPYARPFNWRNICIGLQLVGLLWRNLINIVVEAGRKEAVVSIGFRVLRGCFPAFRWVWKSEQSFCKLTVQLVGQEGNAGHGAEELRVPLASITGSQDSGAGHRTRGKRRRLSHLGERV